MRQFFYFRFLIRTLKVYTEIYVVVSKHGLKIAVGDSIENNLYLMSHPLSCNNNVTE